MTISAFSRYANDTVTPITGTDGVTRSTIVIMPPDAPSTYNVSLYTWQAGDQIEYLSYSAYKDETQWWRIGEANPEIMFWDNVKPGTQVRVPNA